MPLTTQDFSVNLQGITQDSRVDLQDLIPPKTNIVYALDFDGALSNAEVVKVLKQLSDIKAFETSTDEATEGNRTLYQETKTHFDIRLRAIIDHNQKLLEEVFRELPQDRYRKFVTIFSNRQSREIDTQNLFQQDTFIGDCFRVFEALFPTSKHLQLLPILLTDCCNDVTAGTTFNSETDSTYTGINYKCPMDVNKLTVAYEQAHFTAVTYPHDKNIIKIYDDKCDPSGQNDQLVLNKLASFYKKNPDLLPSSVKLELYCYTGNTPALLTTIQGTGVADPEYARTIRNWFSHVQPNWKAVNGRCIYTERVTNRHIFYFREDLEIDFESSNCPTDSTPHSPTSARSLGVTGLARENSTPNSVGRNSVFHRFPSTSTLQGNSPLSSPNRP